MSLRTPQPATLETTIAEFDMVEFYRVTPPASMIKGKGLSSNLPCPDKYFHTRGYYKDPFPSEKGYGVDDNVLLYKFQSEQLDLTEENHILTGSIELKQIVNDSRIDDPDRPLSEGFRLKILLKTFSGDVWASTDYDILKPINDSKIINPYKQNYFTTVEQVLPNKYIVFVDFEPPCKIAIGMEMNPGSEIQLEDELKQFEMKYLSLEKMRLGFETFDDDEIQEIVTDDTEPGEDTPDVSSSDIVTVIKQSAEDSPSEIKGITIIYDDDDDDQDDDDFGEFISA